METWFNKAELASERRVLEVIDETDRKFLSSLATDDLAEAHNIAKLGSPFQQKVAKIFLSRISEFTLCRYYMGDLTSEYNPVLAPVAIKPRTELFGDMLRFMLKSYHKEIDLIEVYQIASKFRYTQIARQALGEILKTEVSPNTALEDYLIACERFGQSGYPGDEMLEMDLLMKIFKENKLPLDEICSKIFSRFWRKDELSLQPNLNDKYSRISDAPRKNILMKVLTMINRGEIVLGDLLEMLPMQLSQKELLEGLELTKEINELTTEQPD